MKRSFKWCLLILLSLIMAVSVYAKEDTAISPASDTDYSALILVKHGADKGIDNQMINNSLFKNNRSQGSNSSIGFVPKNTGTSLPKAYLEELCKANIDANPGNDIHAKRMDGSGCDLYFTEFVSSHDIGSETENCPFP